MTFSIEIVKEGFISKKYAFSGRTEKDSARILYFLHNPYRSVIQGNHGAILSRGTYEVVWWGGGETIL
jgi:hypothetical protein